MDTSLTPAKPHYFDAIRAEAENDWVVWSNPRHGNPVLQLFKQVQSPKHVLSELLQNADDAGASNSEALLSNGSFTFRHDGRDFDDSQFASLCRFAYSNKRTIHTIGFRGIGFKSTFSLGEAVRVETPSLSVEFRRERFTLPVWLDLEPSKATCITVPKVDPLVEGDLLANFEHWSKEPFPLLFLRNLRRLTLPEADIRWQVVDTPTPRAGQWFQTPTVIRPVLLCRSEPEHFPAECLDEIRQERNLDEVEAAEFPPCTVELLVGAPGRLYVVLPTGVELDLGFGINAPFIQDPARFGIKPPSTSPTNRWLLERVGRYAAKAMLEWLSDTSLSEAERAEAYALITRQTEARASLEDECQATIWAAFWERLKGESYVLTTVGDLVEPTEAVLLPPSLADVWSDAEYARVSGFEGKSVASWSIRSSFRKLLREHASVSSASIAGVAQRLASVQPRKPSSPELTARLWIAIADTVQGPWKRLGIVQVQDSWQATSLNIVPAQGSDRLGAAGSLCRLPPKPKGLSDDAWERLVSGTPQVCSEWLDYVEAATSQLADSERGNAKQSILVPLLAKLGIDTPTSLADIVERACDRAIRAEGDADWKWLAEVHAILGLKASESLKFAVRNGDLVQVGGNRPRPVLDLDGILDELLPDSELGSLLLSDSYLQANLADQEDWINWLSSSLSGIALWIAPRKLSPVFSRSKQFERALPHGLGDGVGYHYTSQTHYSYQKYWFVDHKYQPFTGMSEDSFLEFLRWNVLALTKVDPKEWQPLVEIVGYQTPTGGGSGRRVRFGGDPTATWIRQLREVPSLPDTAGRFRLPHELHLRSEKTKGLEGVEAFVAEHYDTSISHEFLLKLGVRNAPQSLDTLVSRLRSLSQVPEPPREELLRLYGRIDQLLPHVTWDRNQFEGGREKLLATFETEPLVFSEAHGWQRSTQVFVSAGSHDLPDVPVVLRDLESLPLWRQIGVKAEPSWEDVMAWVASLPRSVALAERDRRRLQKCIAHDPDAVWGMGCWLSVSGEWVDTSALFYALPSQSFRPHDIVPAFQRVTADFTTARPSLADLPSLDSVVQEQVSAIGIETPPHALAPWLLTVASRLCLVSYPDTVRQELIRTTANALCQSSWQACAGISSVPHLEGTPVLMTDRDLPIHWDPEAKRVFATPMHAAAEADELAKCLAKEFSLPELEKALSFCYERSEEQVVQCLSRTFKFDNNVPEQTNEQVVSSESSSDTADPGGANTSQDTGDSQGGFAPTEPVAPRPPRKPTTVRQHKRNLPSGLVEDYAYQNGFQSSGANVFIKASGERIQRVDSKEYPWEYHREGQLVRRLFPLQARLGSPKVELSYEQWETLRRAPAQHALILLDENHEPELVEGRWLVQAVESGRIGLRIAQYRLSADDLH